MQGKGVSEGVRDFERLAITVTLGKAFGVGGAVVLCSQPFREWLINSARSFIYTTAPPPVIAKMVSASVRVMKREGEGLRQKLWKRAEQVREELERGLPPSAFGHALGSWNRRSPILPVRVPGNDNALRISQNMREFGFEIGAIRYPTVARGSERLRLTLNLGVTDDHTETMVEKLVERWTAYS